LLGSTAGKICIVVLTEGKLSVLGSKAKNLIDLKAGIVFCSQSETEKKVS